MLSRKQKKILTDVIQKAKSRFRDLPEEDALFKKDYPSGGVHKHDENNPFGMHRHFLEDKIDGAHIHSPQNPGGEHFHGENKGMALIDGKHFHFHEYDALGWHNHAEDEDKNAGQIPINKPGQAVPERE